MVISLPSASRWRFSPLAGTPLIRKYRPPPCLRRDGGLYPGRSGVEGTRRFLRSYLNLKLAWLRVSCHQRVLPCWDPSRSSALSRFSTRRRTRMPGIYPTSITRRTDSGVAYTSWGVNGTVVNTRRASQISVITHTVLFSIYLAAGGE